MEDNEHDQEDPDTLVLEKIMNVVYDFLTELKRGRLLLKLGNEKEYVVGPGNSASRQKKRIGASNIFSFICCGERIRCRASPVLTAQVLKVLSVIHQLHVDSTFSTKRDLYYYDVNLMKKQGVTDRILEEIASQFEVPRHLLRVMASPRGLVCGNFRYKVMEEIFEVRSSTVANVPTMAHEMVEISALARFVLVVEKEGSFTNLVENRFHEIENCILVTAKGQPDVATRHFLRRLVDQLAIPIFGLFDADPYGVAILHTYCFGSDRRWVEKDNIALPEMIWLGVFASEFDFLPETTLIDLSNRDVLKAQSLLRSSHLLSRPSWRQEVELMLSLKKKAEIQAFASLSLDYLAQVYLPQKLHHGVNSWAASASNDRMQQ